MAHVLNERWWLYLLKCERGVTYIGTTNDVEARFEKHLKGKGARFTRINKPLAILAAEPFASRSEACTAESVLKKKKLRQKLEWAERWSWSG